LLKLSSLLKTPKEKLSKIKLGLRAHNNLFIYRLIEKECKRHQIDMPEPKTVVELQAIVDKLCQGRVSFCLILD